ncbi:hypothetical protein GQ42DRAFT_162434 [Ramicandelaber brevisporus]|nr:hypothetical protein GQ42DRAFT_162434 [Ramicandelaber brevisporus]
MAILGDIVQSLYAPGIPAGVVLVVNLSLVILMSVLLAFLFMTSFNIHVFVMLLLSICLFVSVNYLLAQTQKTKDAEEYLRRQESGELPRQPPVSNLKPKTN